MSILESVEVVLHGHVEKKTDVGVIDPVVDGATLLAGADQTG